MDKSVIQLSQVTDHLYLSSYHSVCLENIKHHNIRCIISLMDLEVGKCSKFTQFNVEHLYIGVQDSSETNLQQYFEMCIEMIEKYEDRNENVLVHCNAGVSRSASICIAYLMKRDHMTLREAYYHLKSKRKVIYPNIGFWKQLIEYEKTLYGNNTVEILPFIDGDQPDVFKDDFTKLLWTGWFNEPKFFGPWIVLVLVLIWDLVSYLWSSNI